MLSEVAGEPSPSRATPSISRTSRPKPPSTDRSIGSGEYRALIAEERISGKPPGCARVRIASGRADNDLAERASLPDAGKSGGKLVEGERAVDVDLYFAGNTEVGNRLEVGRPLLYGEYPD